jgi:hypothetical protein
MRRISNTPQGKVIESNPANDTLMVYQGQGKLLHFTQLKLQCG